MRKIFAAVMTSVLLILSFFMSGYAETLDLTSMTYEDLAELKQAVDMEYFARPEAKPRILTPGKYIVGQDIEAGVYYVCVNSYQFNKNGLADFEVYESLEVYNAGGDKLWCEQLSLIRSEVRVILSNGNLLCVSYLPVTLSANELTEEQRYKYEIPEGTYIPCGIYTVGEDIPAGSYQVYMGSLEGGEVYVYADESAYREKNYKSHVTISILWGEHVESLSVTEGDMVVVEREVVFRKQEKLVFD